jgi:hypothetical protein
MTSGDGARSRVCRPCSCVRPYRSGPDQALHPASCKAGSGVLRNSCAGLIDGPPGIATSGPGPGVEDEPAHLAAGCLPASDRSARTARMSPRRPRAKHLGALMLTLRRPAFVDVAAGRAGVGPVGRLRGLGWYDVVGDHRGSTECVPDARAPFTGSAAVRGHGGGVVRQRPGQCSVSILAHRCTWRPLSSMGVCRGVDGGPFPGGGPIRSSAVQLLDGDRSPGDREQVRRRRRVRVAVAGRPGGGP